jgi:cob(I)alamin adenosyltransferase
MKVYTKTGDEGTTSLIGGERVSKSDPRVEAYGTVDELAAHLALWADMMRATTASQMFPPSNHVGMSAARILVQMADATDTIQKDLMTLEAMLATGHGGESKVTPLPADAIARLEREIDALSIGLPPIKGFTLPGGHPIVSQSHVCRTVCRRAERAVVKISIPAPHFAGIPGAYLNRLSDWLYVAGRRAAEILKIKERYWEP